jgi:hypothetical protein
MLKMLMRGVIVPVAGGACVVVLAAALFRVGTAVPHRIVGAARPWVSG